MNKDDCILVTGAHGMVGTNLVIRLKELGYKNILTPSRQELYLTDNLEVFDYFMRNKIDYVFHLAAVVGGIKANIAEPGRFLHENLMINCNVLDSAKKAEVKKLIFLGSSCIYPREAPQPMKEEYLLDGKPEPTNEGYSLSKICGLKMCEFYNKQYGTKFISLMPPNMYGKEDCFDLDKSHVISALIKRMHLAKINKDPVVEIWGSGKAAREFLYVGDCVDAMIHFMNSEMPDIPFVNIGCNEDISIQYLAILIKKVVGYEGLLHFDDTKPEGMMRKLMDSSEAERLGWKAKISLEEGLTKTYRWFLENEI